VNPRPVERTGDGQFRLRLSAGERELLRALAAEIRSLLREPEDPALTRLFPPAYEDDAEGEAAYRSMLRDELLDGRLDSLRLLEKTVAHPRLSEDELQTWLRGLNDLRLVLGTRLGVTEELDEGDLDPRRPQARELAVYLYLTWLQEQLLEAVASEA
jgi:hypothetical protein